MDQTAVTTRRPSTVLLRDDQMQIALSPARFKVVACGRRWGKTTLGLALAARAARRGQRVWWVAPTFGLAFHPWRDIKRMLSKDWQTKLESERHIDLPGGGSLTVKSADDPDGLRGVGLDFVVIDEAAFMAEDAWISVLRPSLSDRDGKALFISTPRGRNWFFHAYLRGQDRLDRGWQSWRFPTSANKAIPPSEIDEARALLPERIFQQEYLAEFLAGGADVFRRVREAAIAPAGATRQPSHHYVLGVDFGRHEDFTAVAVIDSDTRSLVELDRFSGVDWEMQRARIAATARRWGARSILAEANAMGEPNIEALRAAGLPVYPFVTTVQSKTPLIENLVKAIESGDVKLLPDETLIGELEAYQYEATPYTGFPRYFAPAGRHDDTVIALALAWKLVSGPGLAIRLIEI